MIFFDGIIYSLQRYGGITVYFNELVSRCAAGKQFSFDMAVYKVDAPVSSELQSCEYVRKVRFAERYRKCPVPVAARLFHSSYYRLPNLNIPVVTTVHDFIYERFSRGPKKWVHSSQKFSAIRASHAVICISESTRFDLFRFLPDVPRERVFVVHNGVSEIFKPLVVDSSGFIGNPFVLFVGARGGYKNFNNLVQAMATLNYLDLICIGGGDLTSFELALVKNALGARFQHLVGVSDEQLNKLYNDAYCLAYPSSYEGFGIPVLEAMRAGCPVVAVNSSSIPEVAGDAALLIDDTSPESIREALVSIGGNANRERYKRLGIDRASHFSWAKTYESTSRIYSSLM